jgi:hypothetical protein
MVDGKNVKMSDDKKDGRCRPRFRQVDAAIGVSV